VIRALAATLLCVVASAARAGDDPSGIAKTVGLKFAAACNAHDVDAVMALYRDDARVVYPGEGETAADKTQLRALVGATCVPNGPDFKLVGYKSVWVDAAHTTIASLGDWNISGSEPDGRAMVTHVRATEVIVKTPAGWRYVVDHASLGVPHPPAEPPPPAAP